MNTIINHQIFYDTMNTINEIKNGNVIDANINHSIIDFYFEYTLWEFESLIIYYIQKIVKIANTKIKINNFNYQKYNESENYKIILDEMFLSYKFQIVNFSMNDIVYFGIDKFYEFVELSKIELDFYQIFFDIEIIEKLLENYDLFLVFYHKNRENLDYHFCYDTDTIISMFNKTLCINLIKFIICYYGKFLTDKQILNKFTVVNSNYDIYIDELIRRKFNFNKTFYYRELYNRGIEISLFSIFIRVSDRNDNIDKLKYMLENIKDLDLEL